jgi:hypothetical protein
MSYGKKFENFPTAGELYRKLARGFEQSSETASEASTVEIGAAAAAPGGFLPGAAFF